jgi:hypothetical protein
VCCFPLIYTSGRETSPLGQITFEAPLAGPTRSSQVYKARVGLYYEIGKASSGVALLISYL